MKRVLVWDLPLRLFHWLFVVSVSAAFLLATTIDDDGPLFPVHSMLGLTAGLLVVIRVLWGFTGTRHARFSSFDLHPTALLRYMKGVFTGGADLRYASHNPATSWFAVFVFLAVVGLVMTGISLARGVEVFEEAHEVLAWSALALVGLHLAGLAWHTVRHRENVAASMITGRKVVDPEQAIESPRLGSAVVFLALIATWSALLVQGYDSARRVIRVPFSGVSLAIGEAEGAEVDEAPESHDEDD